jgi:hypothetical protein
MNTCLRNRALLLLAAGEGTSAQQAHLALCTACAARYRRVVHELESIEWVLRETSPRPAPVPARLFLRRRWLPTVATLAALIALIWGGMWLRQLPQSGVARKTVNQEVVSFLEDQVSPALFAMTDVGLVDIPAPVSNLTYLQAALDDDWPCEQQDPFSAPGCEIHPFPLLFEEQ